ncbi:MAG: hypothetical protein QM778_23780 [Myxococcales bacterium]
MLGVLVAALTLCEGVRVSVAQADERMIPEARIESTRGMALGTGARASAASTQAQADNASNLVLGSMYHLESFVGYQPTFRRTGWGASVVDSMTSKLAAGASARGVFGDNSAGDNSGWEAKVGLGIPILDMLSIGVSGRYVHYTLSDPHAIPEHPATADKPADRTFKIARFSMDASVTLRPINGLSISGLGYNLINTHSPLAPMLVGGSAAYSVGTSGFGLGGDVLVDLKTFDKPMLLVGGGLEFLAQGVAPLRGGYLYDQGRNQHGVTAGLGYISQQVGVQFSLRQMISGGNETTLMGSIQYFVQ